MSLLKPAELLYRGINRLRRFLYRAGVFKAKRLPKAVISVGNIAIGGAGKTPTVIAIARFLAARGHSVVVLTRGYGREGEGGRVQELDAVRYGDEPVVIKKNAPNVEVIVGRNRYQNGLRYSCDVYLLDDGFQHLQLHRDFDLVVDAPNARWYREGPSALRHADAVIPRNLRTIVPDAARGKRLFAFAGLANNEQFFEALRAAGLDIIGTRGFPDHHNYTADDIAALKAHGATLITTEKDAVKIGDSEIIAAGAEMIIDPRILDRLAAAVEMPQ